jgi:hypothetical protein
LKKKQQQQQTSVTSVHLYDAELLSHATTWSTSISHCITQRRRLMLVKQRERPNTFAVCLSFILLWSDFASSFIYFFLKCQNRLSSDKCCK